MRPASLVRSGEVVRNFAGESMKVLASYADSGGSSAAATTWCVEGYVEGQPTSRIRSDPGYLVEVVES